MKYIILLSFFITSCSTPNPINDTSFKDDINKIQMMLPSELFIPLNEWREQTINEIIK